MRTIPHPDASRTIEKNPNGATTSLNHKLDVDELQPLLGGEGIRELANLFSDFQIGLPACLGPRDKKRSGRACPTPARQGTGG
jgi:hypothetical protein